jgi:hypothetical protein
MPTSAQLPQRQIIVFKGRRQHIDLTIPVVGPVGMFLLLLCRSFGIMPSAETEPNFFTKDYLYLLEMAPHHPDVQK